MAGEPALPNLLVIGAMKCATSAIHYCLDVHPEAQMSNPKELNYFFSEPAELPEVRITESREERLRGDDIGTWERGEDWYRRHFDAGFALRGESSPAYTAPWNAEITAARIAALIPDVKLVLMVRDPVVRMLSEYQHYALRGLEWRSADQALARRDGTYIARSRYWARIAPYAERFERDRILVISQERFLCERRRVLRELFAFCGIDPGYHSPKMERLWNTTGAKDGRRLYLERLRQLPGMALTYRIPREWKWRLRRLVYRAEPAQPTRPILSESVRVAILDELADDMARFREWAGRDFPEWSSLTAMRPPSIGATATGQDPVPDLNQKTESLI